MNLSPIDEIFKWIEENSFNVEAQCGTKYIVIDVDEIKEEKEKFKQYEIKYILEKIK